MSADRDDLDISYRGPRGEVEVACKCGHRFFVQASLKGGLTNCPACLQATEVPGGPEGLFWMLLLGGIGLGVLITVSFGAFLGLEAGLITAGVCAVIIVVAVLSC